MNVLRGALLQACPHLRHGFFTRDGGVSRGIYASLNCGLGSNDVTARVEENLRRVAWALGAEHEQLLTLRQSHGNRVLSVDDKALPQRARADAAVTAHAGIALGITGADCPTVLLADPEAGVIGAAHAGWRGASGGVLEATVHAMQTLGAVPRRMLGAIGPGIQQRSYEVDTAFRAAFVRNAPANDDFFITGRRGKHRFDLPAYILARLRRAGIARVDLIDLDTFSDPALFSYRRSRSRGEPDYGRQLGAICLAPGAG